MRLKLHLFHFDHFPKRRLGDIRKSLTIVVFDPVFITQYKNAALAKAVLGLDATVLLTVNVLASKQDATSYFSGFKAVHCKHLAFPTPEQALKEELGNKELLKLIQRAEIQNEFQTLKIAYELLCQEQSIKEDQFIGKAIRFHKKQHTSREAGAQNALRETGELRAILDISFKQLQKTVDEKLENFEKGQPEYKVLQEEISNFLGFVESKGGRYVSMQLSDGAVKDKVDKNQRLLSSFFDHILDVVNTELVAIEGKLKKHLSQCKLDTSGVKLSQIPNKFSKEVLESTNSLPDKSYEKQVTSKGIGSLLMELRTPLFMLMPFMMIFALFGALVGGEDKGTIDESVFFYNKRHCIAINSLPEARGGAYKSFIDDIEAARDPRKGVFDKEISAELLREPQLAVQKKEVKQNFGDKTKIEEEVDLFFDSKKQIVYLFLAEKGDREFVIQQLFDPNNKLLTVPSNTRRGFGLGGLIRSLSGLTEYRYLILIGLVALVSWFIITRKGSMDRELLNAKNREKQKLNNDLKQYIDKNTKQSFQKWRPKFMDELNAKQQAALRTIETIVDSHFSKLQQEKLSTEKIVQKRATAIKTEKAQLGSLKMEHRKVKLKLDQLDQKIKRRNKI